MVTSLDKHQVHGNYGWIEAGVCEWEISLSLSVKHCQLVVALITSMHGSEICKAIERYTPP